MRRQRVSADSVREPAPGTWSNCLRIDDLVFVSGMTARGSDGESIDGDNEFDQAIVVFDKIRALVEAAGGVMNDVVKMTIYVTNISHNTMVWDARKKFFTGDFPACTLVEVAGLAKPEILLEIEAIAIVGCSADK